MSDRHLDPAELQAWLDGEAATQERDRFEAHLRSCQVCRESASRASWEVGLFLSAPAGEGADAPSPDFADRVMARIAGTPPLRALPPVSPAGRAPWWSLRLAAAAAALVAAVLGGIYLLKPDSMGSAVVEARSGGVLRWHGRFDRTLAGSEWIAQGEAFPAHAGVVLHSPSPSSVHLRLPGGGRLETGPSCFLAIGADGEFALLEGAITADAGQGKPELGTAGRLVIEAPGIVATTEGEIEVSVRTPSGAKSGPGARWLGAWAASRVRGAAPGASVPDAPGAAVIVYARRGAVEVAGSPGPVRNQLERTTVPEGQALVLLEGKSFRMVAVDDDAPPERTGWTQGMPVPPDSRLFRRARPDPAPQAPPGGFGGSPGPVRNTLERVLEERNRDAEARAYALSVYEGVGGVEAVAAAAKAADDPAVIVRSAAVRVLALNAWADRPTALEALRRLARDRDAGVARYAILALKTLEDRDAIPVLQGIVDDDGPPETPAVVDDDGPPETPAVVDDDGPPETPAGAPDVIRAHGPPEVAKVYAFDALVSFGDVSRVAKAAELEPKVAGDEVLLLSLRTALHRAFNHLDHATIRSFAGSEIPGARAAAIRALQDTSLALSGLQDQSEAVRLAAVEVHLSGTGAVGLGDWAPRLDGSMQFKARLLAVVYGFTQRRPEAFTPDWVGDLCREVLAGGGVDIATSMWAMELLLRIGAADSILPLVVDPSLPSYAAMIALGPVPTDRVLSSLASQVPEVRRAAADRVSRLAMLPESELSSQVLLEHIGRFSPKDEREALYKGQALHSLSKHRSFEPAVSALLAMARSQSLLERRNAFFVLTYHLDQPEVAFLAAEKTSDPDLPTAFAAARSIVMAVRSPDTTWKGPAFESLFPSTSPHPSVRALLALMAKSLNLAGAADVLAESLRLASSHERLRVFDLLTFTDTRLTAGDMGLLLDPSATVRLRVLHYASLESRNEVASRLRDDPSRWVRAAAHAFLAEAGDPAAEQELRILAQAGLPIAGLAERHVPGLSPDSPSLVSNVMSISRVLASSAGAPVEGSLVSSLGMQAETRLLVGNGEAVKFAALLSSNEGLAGEIRALKALGESPVSAALSTIVPWTLSSANTAPSVRMAANHAFASATGFSPREGAADFHRAHSRGLVTWLEIGATLQED